MTESRWSTTRSPRPSQVCKTSSVNPRNNALTLKCPDGKEVKVSTQQTASDVDEVKRLSSNLINAAYGALRILSGNQLRESVQKWLTPPDPSTNHNIACDTHHKTTATWFFQGNIFQEWKSTGSLLWIHGKRLPCPLTNLTPSDCILYRSWLGKKCHVVRRFLTVPDRDN